MPVISSFILGTQGRQLEQALKPSGGEKIRDIGFTLLGDIPILGEAFKFLTDLGSLIGGKKKKNDAKERQEHFKDNDLKLMLQGLSAYEFFPNNVNRTKEFNLDGGASKARKRVDAYINAFKEGILSKQDDNLSVGGNNKRFKITAKNQKDLWLWYVENCALYEFGIDTKKPSFDKYGFLTNMTVKQAYQANEMIKANNLNITPYSYSKCIDYSKYVEVEELGTNKTSNTVSSTSKVNSESKVTNSKNTKLNSNNSIIGLGLLSLLTFLD